MKTKLNYEESMLELESIVSGIETDQVSIDELSTKVKRATELIKVCKEKLYKTEEDIQKVLTDLADI